MHTFFYLLISIILLLYWLFIAESLRGLALKPNDKPLSVPHLPACSILVAVRNEEQNLPLLITSIMSQRHFPYNWELIFIDDHSEDSSLDIINGYMKRYPNIQSFQLEKDQFGKKRAIAVGLQNARYGVVVQTDADCTFSDKWLRELLSPFENGADLVIGPVQYLRQAGIMNALYRLEFISLVASGAGLALAGHPVFCNAANMAYRADISRNLVVNTDFASGDDVFLLHGFKSTNRNIQFVLLQDATVSTLAPQAFRDFLQQRIRWASKAKYYTDNDSIFLSILIVSVNLLMLLTILYAFIGTDWSFWLIVYFGKIFSDFIFLSAILPFFKERRLILFIPFLSIFYPFYIALASIYSIFAKYEWKGRRLV